MARWFNLMKHLTKYYDVYDAQDNEEPDTTSVVVHYRPKKHNKFIDAMKEISIDYRTIVTKEANNDEFTVTQSFSSSNIERAEHDGVGREQEAD